jgi:hypothetical protein
MASRIAFGLMLDNAHLSAPDSIFYVGIAAGIVFLLWLLFAYFVEEAPSIGGQGFFS